MTHKVNSGIHFHVVQAAFLFQNTQSIKDFERTMKVSPGKRYNLKNKLTPADWQPSSLFASGKTSVLPQFVGIMMQIPQIRKSLEEIKSKGPAQKHIAEITREWVMGSAIEEIAKKYFSTTSKADSALTDSITAACKGIYKTLANVGTWGLSALSKMPTSGLDFQKLSDDERRALNNLPAMIYHGVNTEPAVLMRINSVPRSIATSLGERFVSMEGDKEDKRNVRKAREFLKALSVNEWQEVVPKGATMTGGDYREVWLRLAGDVV